MSSGRSGGSGSGGGAKKEFPPANSSYRDVSTSMVIQTDRSEIVRRDREAGSDTVESLWGRVSMSEMGSRAGREVAPKSAANGPILGLKAKAASKVSEYDDDLYEQGIELKYRPKTKETRQAYEYLMTFLQQLADFSDQPASVLRSATEEVLIILKSTEESWKDLDRKGKIEQILGIKSGEISSEKYSQLTTLGRRITDFSLESDADNVFIDGQERLKSRGEDSQNIAVVFEEDNVDDDDFGEASNLIEDEDENAEDEAEIEKTLPPIARLAQRIVKTEEKVLDLEALAFPEGKTERLE